MPRATKTTKPVIDLTASPIEAQPVQAQDEDFDFRAFASSFGVEIPTGRRLLVASVASCATAALGTYGGLQIASYLAVGAATLTGSAFIAYTLLFIGAIIAVYSAFTASMRAASYIASRGIDRDAQRVAAWSKAKFVSVKSMFKGGQHA